MGIDATVTMDGDIVLKVQSPRKAQLEAAVTGAALEVARKTSLFRVPEVLDIDIKKGVIAFSCIRDAMPVRAALCFPENRQVIVERLADALAAVHEHLEIPPDIRVNMGPCSMSDQVNLHGDFSLENMLWTEADQSLWIIDWSSASWLGEPATSGPSALDWVVLTSSVFEQRAFGPQRTRQPTQFLRSALARYRKSRPGFRVNEIHELAKTFLPAYRRQVLQRLGVLRLAARAPGIIAGRNFLHTLSMNGI